MKTPKYEAKLSVTAYKWTGESKEAAKKFCEETNIHFENYYSHDKIVHVITFTPDGPKSTKINNIYSNEYLVLLPYENYIVLSDDHLEEITKA